MQNFCYFIVYMMGEINGLRKSKIGIKFRTLSRIWGKKQKDVIRLGERYIICKRIEVVIIVSEF